MEKNKKKILITGACGMLGQSIVKALSKDYLISGLDNRKSFIESFIQADITKKEELFSKISRLKPQIIIHAAAYTDVDGCELKPRLAYKINSEATKYIAQISKKINAFLIFISTDYVFDGSKKRPYQEDDLRHAINIYGKSKIKAEDYIKSLLKNYLIIRTSRLFGEKGQNFIKKIIHLAKTKKELRLVSDQVSSPTYAEDLAKTIKNILELKHPPRGILHITNSGSCSWYEFARDSIRSAKIKDVRLIPIPSRHFFRPAKVPRYSVLDNSKFKKLTNKKLRSWQLALKDYLK